MAPKPAPKGTTPSSKRRSGPPSELLCAVGRRVREIRQAKGISQDKLAYSIPLDRAHIGMIENGKRASTIPTLVKLAIALQCEVGDFFPPVKELAELTDLDQQV